MGNAAKTLVAQYVIRKAHLGVAAQCTDFVVSIATLKP
jgi:hypothetical protein